MKGTNGEEALSGNPGLPEALGPQGAPGHHGEPGSPGLPKGGVHGGELLLVAGKLS